MTTHTLKELRNQLGTVVREAVANPEDEHVITDNGTPVAVIMPLSEVRRLKDKAWQAEMDRRSKTPAEELIPHDHAVAIINERLKNVA